MDIMIGDIVEVTADVLDMNMNPCRGKRGVIADNEAGGIYPIRLENSSTYLHAHEFRVVKALHIYCIVCEKTVSAQSAKFSGTGWACGHHTPEEVESAVWKDAEYL